MTNYAQHTYLNDLTGAFPKLVDLSGRRYAVKFGGAAMERDDVCEAVCRELAALHTLGLEIIVVHGGGKDISRLLERLSIPSQFIGGLRVTSPEAMVATEMVLSGATNKRLASWITLFGARAVGISGRDGRLLEAEVLRGLGGEDLGRTGEVSRCDPTLPAALLQCGMVPVISPVGETITGEALNLNADYAAAAISGAMHAEKAIFLTDVDGVRAHGVVQPELSAQKIQHLIDTGEISGGMIPKVTCALRAVTSGAREAVICNAHQPHIISRALLGMTDAGTRITA